MLLIGTVQREFCLISSATCLKFVCHFGANQNGSTNMWYGERRSERTTVLRHCLSCPFFKMAMMTTQPCYSVGTMDSFLRVKVVGV
jgi:hypothetical protein